MGRGIVGNHNKAGRRKGSAFSWSCTNRGSGDNVQPGLSTQGGVVAERITLLLLSALRRAIAEPRGLPLHAGKASACLFPSSALGKQAAQRSLDDGLLQPLANHQQYILSDRGRDWLLQQATPRTVLDDLVRAVEAR